MMRVIEIRQALHDMDDNDVVGFLSDNGEEFHIGGAVHLPEYDILYFGETQPGLEQALEEIEALLDDSEERLDMILAAAEEDDGPVCCMMPEPERPPSEATEEL